MLFVPYLYNDQTMRVGQNRVNDGLGRKVEDDDEGSYDNAPSEDKEAGKEELLEGLNSTILRAGVWKGVSEGGREGQLAWAGHLAR
jgi:hypothetical protein